VLDILMDYVSIPVSPRWPQPNWLRALCLSCR